MIKSSVNAWITVIAAMFLLSACSSSGPATTYYVLDSAQHEQVLSESSSGSMSIGIGPVKLPGYLDNTAIVSRKGSQVLNVSGFHAWSEPLDEAASRLLAIELGNQLNNNDVWSFPRDSRNRPERQVSVVIEQLDGERGKSVFLRAKWFVFSIKENEAVSKGSFSDEVPLDSSSYSDYVTGIAKALTLLSENIAKDF